MFAAKFSPEKSNGGRKAAALCFIWKQF